MVEGQYIKELCERTAELRFGAQGIFNIETKEKFASEILFQSLRVYGVTKADVLFNAIKNMGASSAFTQSVIKQTLMNIQNVENKLPPTLFINVDNASLGRRKSLFPGKNIRKLISNLKQKLVLEISEKDQVDYKNWSFHRSDWEDLGIEIAIDDFGTGYSGFETLYKIQPKYLKMDQFFVRDINRDLKKQKMVDSLFSLSKDLEIEFICEGVETSEELNYLENLGIRYVQGYILERPKPLAEL